MVAHPRFAQALSDAGLEVDVREFPEGTRTAEDAARAVGCELAQIVKSLVFAADGQPVLVLVDGSARVDTEHVRAHLGAAHVGRADASLVRDATGFAIGGVPPFGHRTAMTVLVDRGLTTQQVVWAAAGTPHTVFAIAPEDLVRHAGGEVVDVAEG